MRLERFSRTLPRGEGGWAIMSAMIAIFIGLVMLGGIFGLVQMAMQGSKVQTAQTNLSTIRMGVQKLYTGQPNYSGLDTSTANAAGLFPESMTSGAGPVNAWSGSVQVSVGATPTRFTITFNDVPQEPCIELAKFGYGSWESVEVNGASVSQSGGGAVSDAVAACTSGGNSLVYVSQ